MCLQSGVTITRISSKLVSVPSTSIPLASIPSTSIPLASMPSTSMLSASVPSASVPSTSIPSMLSTSMSSASVSTIEKYGKLQRRWYSSGANNYSHNPLRYDEDLPYYGQPSYLRIFLVRHGEGLGNVDKV